MAQKPQMYDWLATFTVGELEPRQFRFQSPYRNLNPHVLKEAKKLRPAHSDPDAVRLTAVEYENDDSIVNEAMDRL